MKTKKNPKPSPPYVQRLISFPRDVDEDLTTFLDADFAGKRVRSRVIVQAVRMFLNERKKTA